MRLNRRVLLLVVTLVGVFLFATLLASCGGTAATVDGSSTSQDGTAKTIKIGAITDLSFPLEIDWQKCLDAYVEDLNAKGGISVGGQNYTVVMDWQDGKSNAEVARAAVERLINQDKVDFILGDQTANAWISVTEAAKKLVVATISDTALETPDIKLAFNVGYWNAQSPIVWTWVSQNLPFTTVGGMYIDAVQGHAESGNFEKLAAAFGKKIVVKDFYPATTQDFSAVATKVATANPDAFNTQGGGPVSDALMYKGLRAAGYKGLFFNTVPLSPAQIAKVISLDNVEGLTGAMAAIDVDTPTGAAAELKDLFVKKYGEWTNPDISFTMSFWALKAALEKAGSLDTQKVADVLGSGLQFDSPDGPAQMISRPDLGNDRTVDCVYQTTIIRIQGGKAVVQAVIPIKDGTAQAQGYFAKIAGN